MALSLFESIHFSCFYFLVCYYAQSFDPGWFGGVVTAETCMRGMSAAKPQSTSSAHQTQNSLSLKGAPDRSCKRPGLWLTSSVWWEMLGRGCVGRLQLLGVGLGWKGLGMGRRDGGAQGPEERKSRTFSVVFEAGEILGWRFLWHPRVLHRVLHRLALPASEPWGTLGHRGFN